MEKQHPITENLPHKPSGVKEWEAGQFKPPVARKSADLEKDYGYGGQKEQEALTAPGKPSLPNLFGEHRHQAGTRARVKKQTQEMKQVPAQLEGKSMDTDVSKTMKTKEGKTLHFDELEEKIKQAGGASDPAAVAAKIYREAGGKPSKSDTKKAQDILEQACKGCAEKAARLSPDMGQKAITLDRNLAIVDKKSIQEDDEGIKKDFEHMAGEYAKEKKQPSFQAPKTLETSHKMGWSTPAVGQARGEAKQAMTGAKPTTQMSGGATGAIKPAPGVLTTAGATPPPIPKPEMKPGQVVGMQSLKKPGSEKSMKEGMSMTKSAILDLMMFKAASCEQYPGNAANEQGPVGGFNHGGKDRAQTSVPKDGDEQYPGNSANEQESVSGAVHAGKGPEKTSVSGTAHGGKGPAQTSVSETSAPGNESQMNKAHGGKGPAQTSVEGEATANAGAKKKDVKGTVSGGNEDEVNKALTSMAIPRMPRAMAMAMDTWRSATSVVTQANSRLSKHATHHGAGPLFPETCQAIDDEAQERATRKPEMFKSCESCGRTFRIFKSMDEPCPGCARNETSCMAKSRGGNLQSSFIKD